MRLQKALIWQGALALLMAALCASLGVWQLRRLAWKEALLARIESRASDLAGPPPPRDGWPRLLPEDYEWSHVRAEGRLDLAQVALVFSPAPEGGGSEPGYKVLAPLRLASGGVVIVDRGFTSQSKAQSGAWRSGPSGETSVEGWLRAPQKTNLFTPADDPARGKWFTADPQKIAAALGVADAAPFFLEQAKGAEDALMRPAAVDLTAIPNNHFGYALTWFTLALALLIIFVAYARGRLR